MTPDKPLLNSRNSPDPGAGLLAPHWGQRATFHFAPDAQFVTDCSGLILDANHAAAELLRCPKEFLNGKPLAQFSTESTRPHFDAAIAHLAQGGASEVFEAQLTGRGDGPRNVSLIGWAGDSTDPRDRHLHWLARDLTELKRSEAARADLQRRLATAQEDERRRLARDLHDTTGQLLTAIALGVRAVRDSGPLPAAALARLDQLQKLTDELARQVHGLAAQLRPTALDDLGLEAAVRQLVADFATQTGVEADFQSAGLSGRRLPAEVETALFRVVQEALTNVAKHAGARRAAVILGRSGPTAVAVVEDDGLGFDTDAVAQTPTPGRPRLGLLGMRERVALVGGTLEMESAPGQGTTVIARIPFRPEAP